MPQQGVIYRVLIASPSDCVREREILPRIIYAWNATHSLSTGAILEPVLWETHATPEFGDRPQGIINKQLVQNCDILIGTFWTRLGTSTGEAESGTAEEIEQFRRDGKPVLLYFSSMPVVPESLEASQYAALRAYKEKLRPEGVCFDYDDLAKLRELLTSHLARVMVSLHSTIPTPLPAPRTDVELYVEDYERFLRRYEAEWISERDSEPVNITDAQFILNGILANILEYQTKIIHGLPSVQGVFSACLKDIRVLSRHRLFLDGGASWNVFWSKGDAIIESLKTVPSLIAEAVASQKDATQQHKNAGVSI